MKKRMISFLGLLLIISMTITAWAASAALSPEAAKSAALAHANVPAADATVVRVKLDWDDGALRYEVEFYFDGKEYDYDIDANSGKVLSFDSEADSPKLPADLPAGLIAEEAAKAAAFTHAKADEAAATLTLAQLSYDDGQWEYEIEFVVGSTEYDYEIDALTGAVLAFDQDMESAPPPTAAAVGDIGADKAKEIALAHAGLTADSVRKLEAERDKDDGVLKYEVEFKADGKEYSYDIDAATGSILKHEVEND